jgi:hypothetical protein
MKFGSTVAIATAMTLALSGVSFGYDAYAQAIANSVPPSKALKKAIVEAARDILFDPYSVRDAEISNVADFGNGTQGVCVKVNSKNQMGGYTGRQAHAITMSGTILLRDQVNHPLCARPDVRWRKFPELEALRNL